jgi:hypothetical protein
MERSGWLGWLRRLSRGCIVPLGELLLIEQLQLAVLAALIAALLDVVSAWLSWSVPSLHAQYAELNALVARRMGYEPPAMQDFSALGVFTASFFVGGIGAALLWGVVGALTIRGVLRKNVSLSVLATSAVVPLPIVSLVQLAVTLLHWSGVPISIVPSLAVLFDPATADIRLYSIAAKLDLGALLHAGAMVCLAVGCSWMHVLSGGLVAFTVRSILVGGGILFIARSAGLPPS